VQRKARLSYPAGMDPAIEAVVVSERGLARRVREMGAEIRRDYGDGEIVLVGVLRAALFFLADLARAISGRVCVDCLAAASYGAATTSSGTVRITRDLDESLAGRHVLVVDTVLDTGLTFRVLDEVLRARGPASLRYCALVQKERETPLLFAADYLGFMIPDRWVVGYGGDYDQRFRNLPYLGVLRREVYGGTA
jgi:hypoxanthine phosphoribosyltransferase